MTGSTPQMARTAALLYLLMALCLLACQGCASRAPLPSDYRAGAVVETLSSAVSLSMHSAERSMSGQGYMVFRAPDQVHLVMLSPFGTTLMEVFGQGERVTLVFPSRMTAYTGRFQDLPATGGLQGWRMMRWVMDTEPAGQAAADGTVERPSRFGFTEKVTYRNGLVVSKTAPDGSQVYYEKYAVLDGVPLAVVVELRNAAEDRVRLSLQEPEVNGALEEAALTPRLEGMTLLPLSALQGL